MQNGSNGKHRLPYILIAAFLLCTIVYGFEIQAHRGGRGLMPENTMAAFRYTLDNRLADVLELDVVVSKDYCLMVSHDRFLNPQKIQKDGVFILFPIPIYSLTREQLRPFTAGVMRSDYRLPAQQQIPHESIPTLEEVIQYVQEYRYSRGIDIRLNIEIKVAPESPSENPSPEVFAKLVTELLSSYGMEEHVYVQSFCWEILRLVRETNPTVKTAALYSRSYASKPGYCTSSGKPLSDEALFSILRELGVSVFSPGKDVFVSEWVEKAHACDIKIIPWTINEPKEMIALISLGVDGIITDYPDRLKTVVSENSPD
jgi:glycerophosphoryl diester phosphodiesterase